MHMYGCSANESLNVKGLRSCAGLTVLDFPSFGAKSTRGGKVNSKAVTRGTKSTGVRFQRTAPTATHLSTQVSPSHAQALEASPFRALTRTRPQGPG
eukprot:scaffold5944_cov62-Phaeocystis_antarctica.AAC.3